MNDGIDDLLDLPNNCLKIKDVHGHLLIANIVLESRCVRKENKLLKACLYEATSGFLVPTFYFLVPTTFTLPRHRENAILFCPKYWSRATPSAKEYGR